MTKEYALHLLNQLMIGASIDAKPIISQYELAQALDLAIKALEQQSCEDCISREEAINEADNLSLETSYDNEKVEQMLRDLPPVTATM